MDQLVPYDLEKDDEQEEDSEPTVPDVDDGFRSERTGTWYELKTLINEGGFGKVFNAVYVKDGQTLKAAVKVEKWDKSMQSTEVIVLQAAQRYGCQHFPKLIDYGTFPGRFHFMTLTLLGKDLYRLRKDMPGAVFSLSTAIRMGLQTLKAIEELHSKCQFVCRDVKPPNFVIGLAEYRAQHRIFIIDFGLCRKYVDRFNNVIASRGKVGWRGTFRYGSLQCHLRMDLGRKDDIESWFYMLVEATVGSLPWQNEKDRQQVHAHKIVARTEKRHVFLHKCPPQFDKILNKIDNMVFTESPDYAYFYFLLNQICSENQIRQNDLYDWEPKRPELSSSEAVQENPESTASE